MSGSLNDALKLRDLLRRPDVYPEIGEQQRILANVRRQLAEGVDPMSMDVLEDDLTRAASLNGIVDDRLRGTWSSLE